jgi:hypothetical protein
MPVSYFKGLGEYKDQSKLEVLKTSFILWSDWCFVNAGAYFNINIPTSGTYGGDFSTLRYVDDGRYTGQVWQAPRSNMVWESGTSQGTPIQISGVYIDGVLTTTGYSVNYPLGQVVLDTPVSTGSNVQLEYSFKHIKVADANYGPLFRQGQFDSFRVDQFDQAQSGDWSQFSDTRLQFPLVSVDIGNNRTHDGYELGNSTLNTKTDIICHVLAENPADCDRISEIFGLQKDSKIYLVDINQMAADQVTILDYAGDKTNTTQTYPELVAADNYQWLACYFTESHIQGIESLGDVYKRTVRLTCEILI